MTPSPIVLPLLVALPAIGGLAAWLVGRRRAAWARWTAVATLAADLAVALSLLRLPAGDGGWLLELRWSWLPSLGVSCHLAVDGLSLILVLLTLVLGLLAVAGSWTEIRERVALFHLQLLLVLAGVLGVFLALDLVLFYFFWELMLVPMYFLIGIWGHERRIYASIKFFLFTQASGLLMLISIAGLGVLHHRQTGTLSFGYAELLATRLPPDLGFWLMLGFVAAFAVKLPAFLLHSWLPDAHTEAPTAGSVVLAGLLLKTGGYGLLRFALPLLPDASRTLAPAAMAVGAAGVLYGAVLAFAQHDLKRLVAYTSVSHLGFVLIGVYAMNPLAHSGAVLQMVCHGLSTGALFLLAGFLAERLGSRDLRRMGGLWNELPRLGSVGLFFALASLGLPGLGNFVAEVLVLFGAFARAPAVAAVATAGLVGAAIYALWLVQRAFHGGPEPGSPPRSGLRDLVPREAAVFAVLMVALLWLGLYPQPLLDLAAPALETVQEATATSIHLAGGSP